MIRLRTELFKLLRQHHPRVYFRNAPSKDRVYPYLVYNLPNSFDNERQEVIVLDVDVWDYTHDTTAIETLSGQLWKALREYYHIDNGIQFSIFRSNRLILEDDDPMFERRKLIFEIRYLDREE